ncbi:hypothetical protein SAMN02745216_00814 [Desulfatibacillum alkenivorans DSM 16219]|jgi:hypothetical protein|uniref:Uncharacterized protein n=2 Tax=Desulfatibacillum alkenivorans TaxID=259354 RepID=A0A1M6FGI5_9BACT|nr:hypothetical protein SAMN02745216_00814 [Desulfatibacillum alkenivorans DSM 16219]
MLAGITAGALLLFNIFLFFMPVWTIAPLAGVLALMAVYMRIASYREMGMHAGFDEMKKLLMQSFSAHIVEESPPNKT